MARGVQKAERLTDSEWKRLEEIGRRWRDDFTKARQETLDLYGPYHKSAPKVAKVAEDVAYGPHPRHVLDIFCDESYSEPAPIVAFVHGGAFIRGEKETNEFIYANVPIWFARKGLIGVNIEYRRAPEVQYPGGIDDVALAVEELRRCACDYGGDPERIFLIGHSSGGTHVAGYAYDPVAGYLGSGIKGIVLISARLRADALPENFNADGVKAYFGKEEEAYERMSPVTYGANSNIATMVVVSEYDNPLLDVYGAELHYRRAVRQKRAEPFLWLRGHNHISSVVQFNTGEDHLGEEILAFFRGI